MFVELLTNFLVILGACFLADYIRDSLKGNK